MSNHHEHDPMKGHHHHPEAREHRWWHRFIVRSRSDTSDHVVVSRSGYPSVFSYVSGHRDAPLTPRARLLWWLTGLAITAAGIILIVFSR